jgi:multiple sugar transport system substrate-binding protein
MIAQTRRHVLGLAAGATATLVLPTAARAQAPTLQASYSTSAFNELMARAAALYRERGGAAIQYRTPVAPSHDDHLQQTLRWALMNELPDVSFQANNHIARLARDGIAQSLDALAAADREWAAAQPTGAVAQIGEVGGRLCGLPFQISVPILIVNLDLATRAGAEVAALPQDWPGLLALARRITALGNNAVGGFFDLGAAWTWQALVTAAGGRMASADERSVAFGGAVGLAANEIVRGFGEAGMVDMTQDQAYQAFSAGSIGVLATSNNVLAGLQRQSGGRFAIGTVAWPLPAAEGRVPAGGRTGVVFTRDPARQAEAWKFLRFMASPEVQAIVVRATGAVPVDPEAARRADVLGAFYAENPAHQAGLARSAALTGWYSFPGENTVRITQVMIEHLRTVANRSVAPEPALTAMARDVQALLPRAS